MSAAMSGRWPCCTTANSTAGIDIPAYGVAPEYSWHMMMPRLYTSTCAVNHQNQTIIVDRRQPVGMQEVAGNTCAKRLHAHAKCQEADAVLCVGAARMFLQVER